MKFAGPNQFQQIGFSDNHLQIVALDHFLQKQNIFHSIILQIIVLDKLFLPNFVEQSLPEWCPQRICMYDL